MMLGTRTNFGWGRVVALTILALAASVVPLPDAIELLRPDFVALTVLWFCLLSPRLLGLTYAWCAGLALDGFKGVLLGQHALTLTVIAYLASKLRLQVRAFPPLQQSAVILALLWLHEFLLFWLDGVAGHPVTDWRRWLSVPVGAACWPLITALYSRFASRR
ncbi:MAG TPA: rod shape-determining protein MreD [Steroidobacteraceae bacterium]|jgi:rod shape-determining protein MreD|nr:rod shape-determining protein MreD [Steroidobacteraceae bacterium]